jgi:cytochrome P450
MTQANRDSLGTLYHPLQGEQLENPYPFYARARKEEPIFFSPELNTWVVTRYDDVRSVLSQSTIFSSKDALRPVMLEFFPATFAELSKGYPQVPNVIDSDGKEHVRFRHALSKTFAPKRIKQLEPFIKGVVTSLIDAFIDDHKADFMSQFAYPLPLEVALFLIGIPKEDMALAKKLSYEASILLNTPLSEEQQVESARSFVRFQHYLIQLVNERRSAPQEDLVSDLLETPPGEEPFSDAQLAHQLNGIVIAGYDTTVQLLGNGLAILLEQPERWQTLCTHLERIPQAIEEILRYDSPVHAFFRTTTQEVTLGGITLPPEASLMVVFGSANRDETQFPRADEFDMQRSPNRHLAFGYGVHTCIGAFLARTQGRIAFETLCQQLPHLRLASQQTLVHNPILRQRGFARLEIVW